MSRSTASSSSRRAPASRADGSRVGRRQSGAIHADAPGEAGYGADAGRKQFVLRHKVAVVIVVVSVVVVSVKMFMLQAVDAPSISAQAAQQRTVVEDLPAVRGEILDRNGTPIAYTDDARALTLQPVIVRKQIIADHTKDSRKPDVNTRIAQIVSGIHALLPEVSEDVLREKLLSNDSFTYLARAVSTETARKIVAAFPEVGAERQDVRVYPGGELAANIVGDVNFDGNGLIGLESSLDAQLSGVDGSTTYDQGSDGAVIPGSTRNVHPAVNGKNVVLTLDADLQYLVQNEVQRAKVASGAKSAQAVVLDAKTGEVLAMANDNTFNPARPLSDQKDAQLGDLPVSSPFEPGSVNKVVTASAAIEYGLTTPTEVHQVPGSIHMAGVTVSDAWEHGVAPYTTTGIFGKSSNVGTLMLAQRIGEDRYAGMLDKFGLGKRTGVGLPGESGGDVPSRGQWSGGTFANLPIGQGLSMTLLQMTGLYQTIANNGLRIPPRIIASVGGQASTPPVAVQVVRPQTAQTVRDMFRAVFQNDPMGEQMGTGYKGAIDGYQLSGKTGTAQQVNPACGCYSNDSYNITFAGIAPANDPRFVVGIMLDAPKRSSDGSGGQSAAPLFKTIASWALQHYRVPLSPGPTPPLTLVAQ